MSAGEFLWITEADVVAAVDMAGAIAALERGLRAEARGAAQNLTKTHVGWKGGTLHAIGAVFNEDGFAGTKTWAHTEGGATPLLVLFDSASGALTAVVEAFALGQLRTGAASGVATRWLAGPDADELALIGTGKQALSQAAAVAAVRPLRRVRVFGRDPGRRAQFAARAREELMLEVRESGTLEDAVRDAPIITTVTRATEPFLRAPTVARGAHINAVGAIVPAGAEVAGDVIERCGRVVVDSIPQAQRLSRELIGRFGSDPSAWTAVESLASVVAKARPRGEAVDLTLFKSLGMGVSDLALGLEVYRVAVDRGLGRRLPAPARATPRLRTAAPVGAGQEGERGKPGV
jgi:ornithine cyclodeaminase